MKLLNKTQSGRSMVEMLGVLAIIGVLSVGGIAGYSKAMHKYKMNQTMDIVSKVLMNIIELSSRTSDEDRFSRSDAAKAGVFDGLSCNSYGTCTLPIGYKINAASGLLEISMDKSSQSTRINFCTDFLSQHWESVIPTSSYNYELLIGVGDYKYNYSYVYSYDKRNDDDSITNYNLDDIQEACNTACARKDYDCTIIIDWS